MRYDDAKFYVVHNILGSTIVIESASTGRRFESEMGQPIQGVVSEDTRRELVAKLVDKWREEDRVRLALHCPAGIRTRYPLRQRKTREQFIRDCYDLKPGQLLGYCKQPAFQTVGWRHESVHRISKSAENRQFKVEVEP